MRRVTRRYLVYTNAAVFTSLLCLVLFLNWGRDSAAADRAFAWTTVRYHTSSSAIPDARGTCPGLSRASSKPALVVSHVESDGDPKWLDRLEPKYHTCLYDVDASLHRQPNALRVPANRGHEAMAYLTFLIDNYNNIPASGVVFVHGSRFSWHNDILYYDNSIALGLLNVSAALDPFGYHNLRCDHSASTCSAADSPPQGSLETAFNARLQPWDERALSDNALPAALVTLFGDGLSREDKQSLTLGRSHAVRSQCCAQFVVSRERILQHARDEYVALRQWLLDGGVDQHGRPDAAPADDKISGRILSYVWHVLFMMEPTGTMSLNQLNARACPSASDCYCRLYGRCNLQGCTTGQCRGQYIIPPDYAIPSGWAEQHDEISIDLVL